MRDDTREDYVTLYGNGLYYPKKDKGILLVGSTNAGKSTIAYELVMNYCFLFVGDDFVSLHKKSNTFSWGSMQMGSDRVALCVSGEVRDIEIPHDRIKSEAHLDLAVFIEKISYDVNSFDCNMRAGATLSYLDDAKIPVKRFRIKENDLKGTIEDILKII